MRNIKSVVNIVSSIRKIPRQSIYPLNSYHDYCYDKLHSSNTQINNIERVHMDLIKEKIRQKNVQQIYDLRKEIHVLSIRIECLEDIILKMDKKNYPSPAIAVK